MAKRRMFSLEVVDTDAFMDMPVGSQLLYFHLAMRADDDGFISNPKKIIKMIGSQEDEYKVLIAKRFVIVFDTGICVIKHWRIHNYIQADRYHETKWLNEKKSLILKENLSYTEAPKDDVSLLSDNCIQNVSRMDTQVRLGKARLDISCPPPAAVTDPGTKTYQSGEPKMGDDEFDKFWKMYPKHVGKGAVEKKFRKLNKNLFPEIMAALEGQRKLSQWRDTKFIPNPLTWLNQERWSDDNVTVELTPEQFTLQELERTKDGDTVLNIVLDKYGEQKALELKNKFNL